MEGIDLFRELTDTAAEYGWRGIGQPLALTRRYGKGTTTVHVYADRAGRAIVGARRVTILPSGERSNDRLGPRDREKRDTILGWLRS